MKLPKSRWGRIAFVWYCIGACGVLVLAFVVMMMANLSIGRFDYCSYGHIEDLRAYEEADEEDRDLHWGVYSKYHNTVYQCRFLETDIREAVFVVLSGALFVAILPFLVRLLFLLFRALFWVPQKVKSRFLALTNWIRSGS